MKEIWKDVVGYEGYYIVSNVGNVTGVDRIVCTSSGIHRRLKGKPIKNRTDPYGYYHVRLSKDGINKTPLVHRIVAMAFVQNPDRKPQVNHLDENKQNNKTENLVWATKSENEKWGSKPIKTAAAAKIKFSKPILQFDKHMNIIHRWESGLQAKLIAGANHNILSLCCTGKRKTPYMGCYWLFEADCCHAST